MTKQQIGVIVLDDLGKDLALNIESLGYYVSVFNHLMFVESIIRPGNILIMVKTDRQTGFTINAKALHSKRRYNCRACKRAQSVLFP